jgi:hypothetical protein
MLQMLFKEIKMGLHTEIHYKARSMTLQEWAEFLGIPIKTLEMRYRRGDVGAKLFRPVASYSKNAMRGLVRELG